MTVYDYCHIGNARVFIFFDVLVRYLRALGYKVLYVKNITDIDDKIIKRANELHEDYQVLVKRFIDALHEDEKALGNLSPDMEPKVTENIPAILDMIQTLLAKDYAYVAKNGDVYFDIAKFATYGELAHQDLENLRAGARVEVSEVKHDPLDFVLWKTAKENEPFWQSPWGNGRPGWHIECSAMAKKYLNGQIDIHGGGADLVFPHHQNELAQYEAACSCKFVEQWMHVGYVQVDNQKMSKSLGNFFTVREVLKKYNSEVIRFFILSSHYRSPLNYSEENLENAKTALTRFYNALTNFPQEEVDVSILKIFAEKSDDYAKYVKPFLDAMSDDFNTSKAIAHLFDLVRDINSNKNNELTQDLSRILYFFAGTLGLLKQNPQSFLQSGVGDNIDEIKINALINERNLARKNKNWAEADRIRKGLLAQGIILEDNASGTCWKKL